MAAPIYGDSRARFFSRINCIHDFEQFPFDRELFYDIALIIVRLNVFLEYVKKSKSDFDFFPDHYRNSFTAFTQGEGY